MKKLKDPVRIEINWLDRRNEVRELLGMDVNEHGDFIFVLDGGETCQFTPEPSAKPPAPETIRVITDTDYAVWDYRRPDSMAEIVEKQISDLTRKNWPCLLLLETGEIRGKAPRFFTPEEAKKRFKSLVEVVCLTDIAAGATDGKPDDMLTITQNPKKFANSDGFRCVRFKGEAFTFTGNQAAVVRKLWEAWEQGTPDVSDAALLEGIDSAAFRPRLRDVFKGTGGKIHPAWNKMIVNKGRKGTRRLNLPD